MSPVPADVVERFAAFTARARQQYGAVVRDTTTESESYRLPMLTVGGFSVLAVDVLVVEVAVAHGVPHRRWELDLDEAGFEEAWGLLVDHLATERLEPGRLDAFVARVVALVGATGDVTVATVQPEFDRVVTVVPHRSGALPFEVLVIRDASAVVTGDRFGWWDLGGEIGDDGLTDALAVVTQFVVHGGSVRSTWRTCELLDPSGAVVGGPYRDGTHRLRPTRLHFRPYATGPGVAGRDS